jgi:predicted DNA-binding protein (MmcQ/YjbR family)
MYLSGNVPDKVLKKMLDQSYELIFSSLSKKVQQNISMQTENTSENYGSNETTPA